MKEEKKSEKNQDFRQQYKTIDEKVVSKENEIMKI